MVLMALSMIALGSVSVVRVVTVDIRSRYTPIAMIRRMMGLRVVVWRRLGFGEELVVELLRKLNVGYFHIPHRLAVPLDLDFHRLLRALHFLVAFEEHLFIHFLVVVAIFRF